MNSGLIFFGLSVLSGLLLIRPEELRVVRKRRLLPVSQLPAVSLMLLMAVGAEGTLLFYAVWFSSALVGGEVCSLIATRLRFQFE